MNDIDGLFRCYRTEYIRLYSSETKRLLKGVPLPSRASVAAQRPPEMMIPKFLIVAVLSSILGAGVGSPAYTSSVKVQRTNVPSYVEYGAPLLAAAPAASPLLAQLSAAPLSVSSYGKLTSCVSPCVVDPVVDYVPYGPPAPVPAPLPAARIITAYQTPLQNIPVAYPKNDGSSYEYSYLVIDDTTGDQKSQYELSNGGTVRGQYSLLQPDGYVREVQYTADDVSGFNAIVKNFLPKSSNLEAAPANEKMEKLIEQPPTEQPPATTVKVADDVPPTIPPADMTGDIVTIVTEVTAKDAEPVPASSPQTTAVTDASVEVKTDPPPAVVEPKQIVLSYEDLIRCATGAVGLNSVGGENQPSALTYILLPSLGLNRPC